MMAAADTNCPDGHHKSSKLPSAAAVGEPWDKLKALIDDCAKVDSESMMGYTALSHAARLGNLESVKGLVKAGADVNHASRMGFTPLHKAAQKNKPEVIKYLVDEGADLEADVPNFGHIRALALAAKGGNLKAVKALVDAGADINHKDGTGYTPMDYALQFRSFGDFPKIAEYLKQKDGSCNKRCPGKETKEGHW